MVYNELFLRMKNHPSDAHLKASYNRFRNSADKNIKHSKKNYMKKSWKGVNEIVISKVIT